MWWGKETLPSNLLVIVTEIWVLTNFAHLLSTPEMHFTIGHCKIGAMGSSFLTERLNIVCPWFTRRDCQEKYTCTQNTVNMLLSSTFVSWLARLANWLLHTYHSAQNYAYLVAVKGLTAVYCKFRKVSVSSLPNYSHYEQNIMHHTDNLLSNSHLRHESQQKMDQPWWKAPGRTTIEVEQSWLIHLPQHRWYTVFVDAYPTCVTKIIITCKFTLSMFVSLRSLWSRIPELIIHGWQCKKLTTVHRLTMPHDPHPARDINSDEPLQTQGLMEQAGWRTVFGNSAFWDFHLQDWRLSSMTIAKKRW